MDEFVAAHDDMLVLVAAGNDGPGWQVSTRLEACLCLSDISEGSQLLAMSISGWLAQPTLLLQETTLNLKCSRL